MAQVTYFDALAGASLGDFIEDRSLHVVASSRTSITFEDKDGDGFTVLGRGLKLGALGIGAGTVTGFRAFDAADETLLTISDISIDAQKLSAITATAGLAAALLFVFKGGDTFNGSSHGDLLFSSLGNDQIFGNLGDDVIAGSTGNDTIEGGGGSDQFLFVRGDGVDLITDFEDTGANVATDDHIVMKRALFSTMVKTDAADGVHLDFAGNTTIILQGLTAADITREDFVFV